MQNEVVIAAAGGGKTTRLTEQAYGYASGRVAVVSYTTNNVEEIRRKLYDLGTSIPPHIEIWSWYRFLLQELARPYQRSVFDSRLSEIAWTEGRSVPYVKRSSTEAFFFAAAGRIYSDKLARFALECNERTDGSVIKRLEERFHSILIDEIQDMAGYDLEVLELILRSKIRLILVGDHRQATYATNHASKNSGFSGRNIVGKFQEWERKGLLAMRYMRDTHRCNQRIADFADSLFPSEPKTQSLNHVETGHDGIYLVATASVEQYIRDFQPTILRLDRRTPCDGLTALNYGEVKGLTFDRVLAFPHGKARKWLSTGDYSHIQGSIEKQYVGITRARHSFSFVFDGTCKVIGPQRHA